MHGSTYRYAYVHSIVNIIWACHATDGPPKMGPLDNLWQIMLLLLLLLYWAGSSADYAQGTGFVPNNHNYSKLHIKIKI